ncbi:hypothetical protein FRB94_007823 [Tulasnella sp. JGI-2019a]|nr:hypothetical protein FRB93_007350 [Tulasnella sp. JGI-2019a]KAG8997216.1 hypothetical protein FRB94_007823 [Tulasnella sp. JGI-2019a]KAG9027683.1 hypothetical protein FRB95_007454 [Tulasnella sp. JGI-2019a]
MQTVAAAVVKHQELTDLSFSGILLDTLGETTLQVLGACSRLQALKLNFRASTVAIEDEDIGRLLACFVHLEALALDISDGNSSPSLTMRSLLYALKHCPSLHKLTLVVDATLAKLPTINPPLHQMPLTLDVSDTYRRISLIDSVNEVAAFISGLTDHSIHILVPSTPLNRETGAPDRPEKHQLWVEVGDLAPWFQKMRKSATNLRS